MTRVKRCYPCKKTSAATYQDERYGKYKRIHNGTSDDPPKHTCTVCGVTK